MTKSADDLIRITELMTESHLCHKRVKGILDRASIKPDAFKRYPAALSRAAIFDARDLGKTVGNRTAGRLKTPDAPARAIDPTNAAISQLAEAKLHRETLQSRRLEVMIARETGKLIQREKVEATASAFVTVLREAILSTPKRCAPLLVGVKSPEAAAAIIDAELRAALVVASQASERLLDA